MTHNQEAIKNNYEYELIRHVGGMHIKLFMVTIFNRQAHFHNDIEIIMPIQGSVYVDVANMRHTVNQDEIFLVNKNEAHGISRSEGPNVLLILQMDPNFCKVYYPKLSQIRITQPHIRRENSAKLHARLQKCLTDMVTCFASKKEGYQLALTGTLNYTVYNMLSYSSYEVMSKEQMATQERNRERLSRIVNYIQQNYMYRISLGELSKIEMLDMTYLSHFIKDNLGISFREYVNRLRLERAAELIANTNMRKIDICVECGFSDCRYLNQALMKEYGCTPTQLKKMDFNAVPPFFMDSVGADSQQTIMNIDEVYGKLVSYMRERSKENV